MSKLDTSVPLLCPGLHQKYWELQVVPEPMHFLHNISAHTFLYRPWVLTSVWFLYGISSHKFQGCSAVFSISMYPSWRDGSVGKSTWCASMETWVQIPSIYIKSWAWLHVFVTSLLWGKDQKTPRTWWLVSLVKMMFGLHIHMHSHMYPYTTHTTHTTDSDIHIRPHSSYSSFMCICY